MVLWALSANQKAKEKKNEIEPDITEEMAVMAKSVLHDYCSSHHGICTGCRFAKDKDCPGY